MGRPVHGYHVDGESVPGVTTVLNRYKDSGGLIHWAWTQGRDGKDYRETKQSAADAGQLVHQYIEADWHQKPCNMGAWPAHVYDRAKGAIEAYARWKEQTGLKVVGGEMALVSRTHRYGGTPDALLVQGKLAIGDWKSSNGVYPDMLMQLAAYKHLWEENNPEQPITGGFHLLRFNKPEHPEDPISFEHRFWDQLELAWEQFQLLLKAYKNDRRLKSMV